MKTKTLLILFFGLFILTGFLKAQQPTTLTKKQKTHLQSLWYESPKESVGDTLVFRKTKYILQKTDNPAFAFSELTFSDAINFKTNYWRWCSVNSSYGGKWSSSSNNSINLDFGTDQCKNEIKIIEINETVLKIIIKEI